MKRAGLTLIEILASIAILLILAGITFSVYQSGVRRAKSSVCAEHLKQLGLAIGLYCENNDGFVPPYSFESFSRPNNILVTANADAYKSALATVGASEDLFYCPLDSYARKTGNVGGPYFDHTGTSYYKSGVYFEYGDPSTDWISMRLSDVPRPAESKESYDWGYETGRGERDYETSHGDRSNVLYFDWHITNEDIWSEFCHYPGQREECPE